MSGFEVMVIVKGEGEEVYNNSTTPPMQLGTVRPVFPSLTDPTPRYQGRGVGEYADIDTGPRHTGDEARTALIKAVQSRQP